MSNKLDEILKQLTGNSQIQSSTNISKPKKFAHDTLDAFDVLAQKNTKQNWTKSIWKSLKWWVKNKILPEKSDKEIRADLKSIWLVLNPLFSQLDDANELQEARKINDPKIQKMVESLPENQDIMELVDEIPVLTVEKEEHGEL